MVVEAINKRVASLLERLSEASSVPKEVVLEEALKLWAAARELDLEGPQNDEEPRCALACPLGSSEAPPRPKRRASRGPASREEEAADEGAPADEQGGWSWLECLPDILGRLKGSDGESQLAKARMVCSHWSKAAFGTVTSWDMVFEDRDSRAFRALRHFSSLKELTIFINNSGFAESFNELISAACCLPNMKTLNLCYEGCYSEYSMLVPALMPLLPRLETLKFSAYNDCEDNEAPDASALTQALAAASNLTDLDLSVKNTTRGIYGPNSSVITRVPVEGLAALPSTLTRLRIDNVAFGQGQSLQTLCCLPHLEELWIAGQGSGCSFDGDMGLRFATSLTSLTCCFNAELKESDLEDILTLQGLRHLRLSNNITSSFVRRLPSRMPSLVSLSLRRWQCITDASIEALGSLTGPTSLGISAHYYDTEIMMAPESLKHLSTLTLLQRLELHNHNAEGFLDLGLPHLHALPSLKSLDLGGTPVDSAEVMKLLPPALEHIYLSSCFEDANVPNDVIPSVMRELQKQCRNLVSIDLSYNLVMGIINGLRHFSGLQQLQQVIVTHDENDGEEYDAGETESSEWLADLKMLSGYVV